MLQNVPGYKSQIAHIDDTKQSGTIGATSILIVVSVLAVAGRLTAHRMVQPRLLADDYCAIVALVCMHLYVLTMSWNLVLTMFDRLSRSACVRLSLPVSSQIHSVLCWYSSHR